MRVNKCDYCGTETLSTLEWYELSLPWPDQHPERGYMMLGKDEKEFCSAKCVIAYLGKEESE